MGKSRAIHYIKNNGVRFPVSEVPFIGSMKVGKWHAANDLSKSEIMKFVEHGTYDPAYPEVWAEMNREEIRRHGGCLGWSYENERFGEPIWKDELWERLEDKISDVMDDHECSQYCLDKEPD